MPIVAPVRPEQVVVHPLVLLSVVDHYKRVSLAPGKRVCGVLLGQWNGHVVNVTNSYAGTNLSKDRPFLTAFVSAVPFEESDADPSVWFIDHNYHENMSELYKKVAGTLLPSA
jgi:26S proteasome regulatory subunit N8